jgi:hypothetical protein
MDERSDLEPTPLRLRLGPRADDVWHQPIETAAAPDMVPLPSDDDHDAHAADVAPRSASPRAAERDRAIEQAGSRVDEWISDQQRRLAAGLDLLATQVNERRQEELARLEAWKASERDRLERELAAEEERFHQKLMAELVAFEEQLGLRLAEQEERLARWLAEAKELTAKKIGS